VNADAKVIQNMTGTTPARVERPGEGRRDRQAQIDQGADVVYAAAGGTGIGVLQAAADEGKLGIGVDSNQNYLHPGKVLTSMLKRVDNAVFDAFSDGPGLETGINVLGVANGGVAYALDEFNASLTRWKPRSRRRKPVSSRAPSRCMTTCPTTPARWTERQSGRA
jgi:basic membrane protein A